MQNKTLSEYISELKSFINNNDYLPCIDLLLQAIKYYPHEEKLKLNLGNIYKMLEQKDEAINVYTSLLETPYSSIANNNLSVIMLELGENEKCIEYAREALKSNKEYNDAKYNLAVGLFEHKEYLKSLDIYPINYHPVVPIKYNNKESRLFSNYIYLSKDKNKMPYIPFSSSFMVLAKNE